jgi:programmed cell death 6-interacting protein
MQSLEYGQSLPSDLTELALKSLEVLMLAQAQECVWQRAILGSSGAFIHLWVSSSVFVDNLKNGVIAKLAMKVDDNRNRVYITN